MNPDNELQYDGSDMDIDSTVDLRASQFGQPSLLPRRDRPDHAQPNDNQTHPFVANSPRPSSSFAKKSGAKNARASISSHAGTDVSPFPLRQPTSSSHDPRTPTQSRGQRARTATPAAPSRPSTRASRKRPEERSPTPQPSRFDHETSDEEMTPRSTVARDSSPESHYPTPPHHKRGRGRYSVARATRRRSQPTPARTPSPDPYDIIMQDPDIVVPPAGSFRRVQGDRVDWKKRNMDMEQIEAWKEICMDRPTVAVQVGELGTEAPGVNERIDDIGSILFRLSQTPGILVTPAHPPKPIQAQALPITRNAPPKPTNKDPVWYLVDGLSEKWCAALIRAAWLSTVKLSLNFEAWTHEIPNLCAAFRLIYRFRANNKDEYDVIVRRELLDSDLNKVVVDILLKDIARGGRWRRYTRDDAFGEILDSVDVDIVHCNVTPHLSEPVAFLHISSPTSDWQDWLVFCDAIRKHGFGSTATGHPVLFTNRVYCGYCHSLGHTHRRTYSNSSRQTTVAEALVAAEDAAEADEDVELEVAVSNSRRGM
ncbi:uncharacterized protein C8Q71DRAFT_861513 [Rhodofomes roseus]|uniref:Uncharacterized protein n=1 Tax=Rhodofomes roseus TaxID=34475 RepID=A0ABQ8K4S2_9APHY|nr:uncharacterized protein C8Q71DRAFT_861513 [Rhodofomes roseus]KAH9831842.1 hypothetical protein C8Q71DRAFT_861513 [Rhodofomes roseus]